MKLVTKYNNDTDIKAVQAYDNFFTQHDQEKNQGRSKRDNMRRDKERYARKNKWN